MCPVFLGEALFLLGAAVIDIHHIHRTVANVGQHIYPPEVPELICHGGKALGKNIRPGKVNVILHTPESEVYAVLLKQIFLESVFLLTDLGERQTSRQMDTG